MRNIKAYVRWLYEKGYVRTLTPMEVPNINRPQAFPKYLTKEEMGKILQHVEDALAAAKRKNNDLMLYTAYLWRALVWFLYTTGLRNFEIRKLEMQDLNMDELSGTILGKGDKLAIFTYNHTAKEKLATYLAIRKKVFPKRKFKHLFTPYSADSEQGLSAF
jgi:site-specific recombinase XerD